MGISSRLLAPTKLIFKVLSHSLNFWREKVHHYLVMIFKIVLLNQISSNLIHSISEVRMAGRNSISDDKHFQDDFITVKMYAKIINKA